MALIEKRLYPLAAVVAVYMAVAMYLVVTQWNVEFIATQTMTWTNVGGYENTGWDLVSNSVGSGVFATWALLTTRR